MSHASKSKRRRKKLRRERNRLRKEGLLKSDSSRVRRRTSFFGKARSGDAAALNLTFSKTSVPFDPESATFPEETARRVAAVEAWDEAGNPTSGEG